MGAEVGHRQADEAYEGRDAGDFRSPPAEAPLAHRRADALSQAIALRRRQRRREVRHHLRVGVQGRKGREVAVSPGPQEEALGGEGGDGVAGHGKSPSCYQRLTSSRSEEHTSELQSLMRISYAVFCLKKKK